MKNLHLLIAASLVNLMFVVGIVTFVPKQKSSAKDTSSPSVIAPTQQVIYKKITITVTPIPQANEKKSNSCVVTVNGVRYDVFNFRQIHSGGDIFQCESDMTKVFWEQHNQQILDQMSKYKI